MNPMDRLRGQIQAASDSFFRERASEVLKQYRPNIVADVGEQITNQVLDHPGLWDFLARSDEREVEPEEAAHDAAVYVRDHRVDPAQAFIALMAEHAEHRDDED